MKKIVYAVSFTCLITIVKAQHPARPFNSVSPYNHRIVSNPVLDPNKAIAKKINAAKAPLVQIYEYPPRIYYVNGNTERHIAVTCTEPWGTCELSTVAGGVPIPVGAQGAVGDDAHMVIWDTVNNISYDFWQYRYPNGTAPEGQTSWGGFVSTAGNGVDKPNTGGLGAGGATGSDIARVAGIIRLDEIKAGVIHHALIGPTDNSCNIFRWPALKSDGWSKRNDCIAEGAHIQLDPSINLNTVTGMRPIDKMIAKALQVYGWYNVDNGGPHTDGSSTKWYIQFEVDPTATGSCCPSWCGGTIKEPGAIYCDAGFGGDYDMLRGTCQDGSPLFSHIRVLADAQVLPITISKFYGKQQNNQNILHIEIAESENVKSILLERSKDGIHFTALSNVSETWEVINGAHVYADAQPLKGNNFYRLNIADNDGRQTVSDVVLLANNHVIQISLYPKPFKNYVMLKADAGKYFVSVADVKGKNIYNNTFNTNGNDVKISLPGFAKGVYYIAFKNENGNIIQKEKIVK